MTEKIDQALNESRILVLVVEVMLGFQYQAVFQNAFEQLPRLSQYLDLGGLILMLLTLILLLSPTTYHQIVERGEINPHLSEYVTKVLTPALFLFALGLGCDFYIVGQKILGDSLGFLSGGMAFLMALFFWYGLEFAMPGKTQKPKEEKAMPDQPTPIKDKIKFVLTEARVVLPGVQALLGFQFAIVLTTSFMQLPARLQYIHLASLANIAVCTILLMAPAAFHRIVEQGQDTERLHTFASRMILGSMVFLALGIAADVWVVVEKVTRSAAWGIGLAGAALLLSYGFWFGYMLYRKAEHSVSAGHPAPSA